MEICQLTAGPSNPAHDEVGQRDKGDALMNFRNKLDHIENIAGICGCILLEFPVENQKQGPKSRSRSRQS